MICIQILQRQVRLNRPREGALSQEELLLPWWDEFVVGSVIGCNLHRGGGRAGLVDVGLNEGRAVGEALAQRATR